MSNFEPNSAYDTVFTNFWQKETMSKHHLSVANPPAKRVRVIKRDAITSHSSDTFQDKNSTTEYKCLMKYVRIEIDNESDEFSRETLKHFKFFRTKFSQRWTKSQLQQSNEMSLKDVGFKMKHFKMLVDFVNYNYRCAKSRCFNKNRYLDLSFADGHKDLSQLREILKPLLLCNDFFECDKVYSLSTNHSINDNSNDIVTNVNLDSNHTTDAELDIDIDIEDKGIEFFIADYLHNYTPGITLSKRAKLLETEQSKTMIAVLKTMDESRYKICRENELLGENIGSNLNNHSTTTNTRIRDATQKIELFKARIDHLRVMFDNEREDNNGSDDDDDDDYDRDDEDISYDYKNYNYQVMLERWKIIVQNGFLTNDIFDKVLKKCLAINITADASYYFYYEFNSQRAKMLFEIISDLLTLKKEKEKTKEKDKENIYTVKWKDRWVLAHRQVDLAVYLRYKELDFYTTFGDTVKNMTKNQACAFINYLGRKFNGGDGSCGEYQIEYIFRTSFFVEHSIKFCQLLLNKTRMKIDQFFEKEKFGFTILICLCQNQRGKNWIKKELFGQKIDVLHDNRRYIVDSDTSTSSDTTTSSDFSTSSDTSTSSEDESKDDHGLVMSASGDTTAIKKYFTIFIEHANFSSIENFYNVFWNSAATWINGKSDRHANVWKLYSNVITMFVESGLKIDELNDEHQVMVINILIEKDEDEWTRFVINRIRNKLNDKQAANVYIALDWFWKQVSTRNGKEELIGTDLISELLNKANFNQLYYDYRRQFNKCPLDGILTWLDKGGKFENWFENIFIAKKKCHECTSSLQEKIAKFIATEILLKNKCQDSVAMIKFVNETLGTKWYVKKNTRS